MISRDAIRALELEAISAALAERSQTALGAAKARALAPLASAEIAEREAARVAEWMAAIAGGRDLDLEVPASIAGILSGLAKDGLVLGGEELHALGRLSRAAARSQSFLRGLGADILLELASPLPGLAPFEERLCRALDADGRLLDGASPELASIRSRRRVAGERMDRAVERFFDGHASLGERIVTLREERTVVALRADLGASRLGLVHGRSSSGATLYVEPFELVEGNNQAVLLAAEEMEESARILRALSAEAQRLRPELMAAAELVGRLDFLRARARFARDVGGARVVAAQDGGVHLLAARHPRLLLDRLSRGESLAGVVPLSLDLGRGESLVITGPNTGGKTVALKTVGLALLLYACGVPVPAERAELPFLASLHIDIGDPQDIAQNLSTFSGHVANVVRALADLEAPALLLLDELGAGTDPREGAALAIAVLEHLRARGVTTLVTSHHEALKRYALSTPGVRAAAVEFDERTLMPTYRLLVDRAGRSNALIIAERLGMPDAIVAKARELLAGNVDELEQALARLDQAMGASDAAQREAELRRVVLEEERAQVAAQEERLRAREAALRERETGIRGRLREEAEARVASLLAELRREGAELLAEVATEAERRRLDQRLAQRIGEATRRVDLEATGTREADPVEGAEDLIVTGAAAGLPAAGERVRVRGLGVVGTVVALDGRRAEIESSGKRLQVSVLALERVGGREARQQNRISLAVESRASLAREINLVGMSVEDALVEVDKFLDSALLAQLPELRIIHGHGTGRLRAGIQAHLRSHPAVRSIETVSEGGATRAVLEG